MNQQLYQQLLDAGKILITQEKANKEILRLHAQMEENSAATEQAKKKIQAKPKAYVLRLVLGIAALYFGFPMAFCLLLCGFGTIILSLVGLDLVEDGILMGVLLIIVDFPFIVITGIGAILLWTNNAKTKKLRKSATADYERIKAQNEEENSKLDKKMHQVADEIVAYLEQNEPVLAFLPEDYRTIHAVGFMLKAVRNLRADTLKEAINLYDMELKHLEAMAAAEQQRIQNEQLRYTMELVNLNMETMNANQERTNRKLDDIQFMQTMQMFDD